MSVSCSVWSLQLQHWLCSFVMCLERHFKEFTLGFMGILLTQVGCVSLNTMPFPVQYLLWDPFSPKLLTVLCAQWCSLFIIFCRITEESAVTTFEALKARVRELERQLSRGDRYKCLICMVSSTPLVVMNQKCLGIPAEEGRSFSPFSGSRRERITN